MQVSLTMSRIRELKSVLTSTVGARVAEAGKRAVEAEALMQSRVVRRNSLRPPRPAHALLLRTCALV